MMSKRAGIERNEQGGRQTVAIWFSRTMGPLIIMLLLFKSAVAFEAENNLSFDFYSQENGLSNNQIHCLIQDKKGWMWIGTSQGVCRFDGYDFSVFDHQADDSTSLRGNLVRVIFEDRQGQLWIGTENGGINHFNREKECFSHPFQVGENPVMRGATVTSMDEDADGNLWIGTDRRLYRVTGETIEEIKPANFSNFTDYFRVVRCDAAGRIWLGTNHGLYLYQPKTNSVERIFLPEFQRSNEEIWEISPDSDGTMWVGSYANGMYIVNQTSLTAQQILLDPQNERSRTVRAISKDRNGKYWIGTRGGLYVYEKGRGTTAFYYHDEREPKSLVNNSVLCIRHDAKGDVWIGTRSGINFLIDERQNILGYKAMQGNDRYLNSSEIYGFWLDPSGEIWIATEDGGINILDRKSGRFRYLKHSEGNPNSLSRNCIKALLDDGLGNMWIGTFMGGIDVLNRTTGRYTHHVHDPESPGSLSDNRVWALLRDHTGEIWIGTTLGVDKYDRAKGNFIHYPQLSNGEQVNWLAEDRDHQLWIGAKDEVILYDPQSGKIDRFRESTRAMLEDSQGRFWLTTQNRGIALFSKSEGVIKYYDIKSGLANNQTLAILEDSERYLWISTTNGLSKFDPEKERFFTYTSKDGFQNNQFTYGAAFKAPNGEMLFGGIAGFNIFNPMKMKQGAYSAPIVLTDLKIFNKSVPIGNHQRDILTKSISETEQIVLDYDQNVVSIDFASLNYASSQSNLYSYYLEEFDKDWNEPSVNRSATYTNLDPGVYYFHVKTVSIDRKESSQETTLKIVVQPPVWRTWWFRLLIFLTIIALIYFLINFLLNKEKLKNELVYERIRAKKLHELDMMKLRFYTNISHEIRTPLTLILGPLEKMISNNVPQKDVAGHLEVMHRNATQLLNLINQLLDFRKLEAGNLKLVLTRGDIAAYVGGVVHSFNKYAEDKDVELKYNTLRKEIFTNFDADKLGKILNNLLSNAFKYTGKGGKISVNLSLVFDSEDSEGNTDLADKQMVEITVKDTGIGISESNLKKIFVRFFQVEDGSNQAGTGIGLSLTKELVKLHNGTISVVSKPGKGSKFTVRLPYEPLETMEPAEVRQGESVENEGQSLSASEDKFAEMKEVQQQIMLLVDDNPDVRYFVKSHFADHYHVVEAADGNEAWLLALKLIPDIIISDIMMPDLDGFEFCKRIRKDERTSHIPILLLTALGSREHEIQGLTSGADDYITKPFDLGILQTKVENLLALRQSLKQKFTGELVLQPKNVIISSPDERFLQKAIEVVERNIADPDLDIEKFSAEIGVSRMQLYRKLDALTEMTVKEFVRNIRLKRAAQLLVQKKMNVSEVAYAVGFRDLSHFRKCFRQEFGMSATEYADKSDGNQ